MPSWLVVKVFVFGFLSTNNQLEQSVGFSIDNAPKQHGFRRNKNTLNLLATCSLFLDKIRVSATDKSLRLHVAVDPEQSEQRPRGRVTNGRVDRNQGFPKPRRFGRSCVEGSDRAKSYELSKERMSRLQTRRTERRRKSSPESVETRLLTASDSLRLALSNNTSALLGKRPLIDFPTVRECNEALAAFGDAGDLLRALRMFGKMRKLQRMKEDLLQQTGSRASQKMILPVPSLVTYSTLMSRAVKSSKPRVALRLWDLMGPTITPDVKAANILMNCFAKLANVKRAKQLLHEMKTGTGPTICRPLTPNLVTINTLLNACQKAEDLDAALEVKMELEELGIRPDARTYTTLIATVSRSTGQRAGKNDPSLAFALLEEMTEKGIQPNGMTYSALINACGRCLRSDLALQGLRIMTRQKVQEQKLLKTQQFQQSASPMLTSSGYGVQSTNKNSGIPYTLPNEVGAWTAAIDACGKANRIDTALKLFYGMPNFGCEPNTVTCGCLTNSLLRAGRTAETLEVLRYMKRKDIEPSEVMYTSLMTRAEYMVRMENNHTNWAMRGRNDNRNHKNGGEFMGSNETSGTKAIEVYTELMRSLIDTPSTVKQQYSAATVTQQALGRTSHRKSRYQIDLDNNNRNGAVLVKVFLVFQQMKASGATPDIACYNALLKACARAGEFDHGMRVMEELLGLEDLHPNDKSWQELLLAASKLQRSDWALNVWRQGLAYHEHSRSKRFRLQTTITHKNNSTNSNKESRGGNSSSIPAEQLSPNTTNSSRNAEWIPSISSFSALISAFVREAEWTNDTERRMELLGTVVEYYCKIALIDDISPVVPGKRSDDDGMNRIDRALLLEDRRALLLVLRATVTLRDMYGASTNYGQKMESLSISIIQLESFANIKSQLRLARAAFRALKTAESWLFHNQQHGRRHDY